MNEEYFEIPDEELKTEDEIKQRIAEKQKIMASLFSKGESNKWLNLNDSVKKLKQRLEEIKPSSPPTPRSTETVEERLLREAKERYEKRSEDAGDNWWEMFD
ncbi:MAG TPA: hypothetical protein PK595_05930 [Bacteroidota bacterium]|jgi:hypothetical protein|nr:hypothetical protein [Bacteroidota bacterium]